MHIQQVRQERYLVTGSDGKTRTEVRIVPQADAVTLHHDGQEYETEGNGVFNVPDDLGRQLVGGLFKDVSGVKGASISLSDDHKRHHPKGVSETERSVPKLSKAEKAADALEAALEASDEGEEGESAQEAVEELTEAPKASTAKKAAK